MAFWIIAAKIFGASIVGLLIYLIFNYTAKPKSYDEAMAEQRKFKRHFRSEQKQSQPKKQKRVKESSQTDKQATKAEPPQAAPKDAKKTEAFKNGSVAGVDRVDGNINTVKKKNDKVHGKFTPPSSTNSVKTNINGKGEDTKADVNKKSFVTPKNNEGSSSSATNSNGKRGSQVVSSSNAAADGKKEAVSKEKPSKMNKVSSLESSDSAKNKTNPSDSREKQRDSKKSKQISQNDENIVKSGSNQTTKNGADEKGASETKLKHNDEGKSGRTKEKAKQEESKSHEKPSPSVSKNKVQIDIDGSGTSAHGSAVSVEQNTIKEAAPTKADKSSSKVTSNKKSNNTVAKNENSTGKTNLTVVSKSLKSSNNTKSSKKTTVEDVRILQKLSDGNSGAINVSLLMPLITKAELSRSEYQNLIDLLLNKQQENCIDAEWIESGRQDPVVKLKKQLAEKEKALSDEQEAHQAIQSKLRELRTELNAEKHINRQLEETLNARQVDLQTVNARLQSMTEEKQNYSKQLQQLQNKYKEERLIANSLQDESSKTKNNLQHELLSQRQQLELHIAHMNEQHQQEIVALETQLNQLASQLQEQEATNARMTDDMRECALFRERAVLQENQVAHLQQTLMQLEELRPIKAELERLVSSSQFEVKRLTNELQSLTEQLNRRNVEIEKFNCTVQKMKIESQELLKENSRNNEQIKFAYNEKAQLQMEKEKLRNELQKLGDQYRSSDDVIRLESELESYRNELADKNAEIKLLNEHVAVLRKSEEQRILQSIKLEDENESTNELKESITKQMKKNEDLRRKNWKVMEALSSMEKTLESKVKEVQCSSHDIKLKERELVIEHLKNVLPVASDLNTSKIIDDEVWSSQLEHMLQNIRPVPSSPSSATPTEDSTVSQEVNVNMLDELEKQNKQLQSMVGHYKNIISDTEGMLNSLQNHVEQEENRWREQVQHLQADLGAVTEERDSLLQKINIQNGSAQNDVCCSEQIVNGIDKLPSTPSSSSPVNKIMMAS